MGRSKNSGHIVTYTTDEGTVQMAIMRHTDQTIEFTSRQSAKLELIDDKFTPITVDGKPKIVVKQWSKLRRIGMID